MEQGYFSLRNELPLSSSLQSRIGQAVSEACSPAEECGFLGRVGIHSVLSGKEVPHGVAEFRGSVAMQQANASFKGCASIQCLGRPELNTSHLTDAFGYSISGASCTRRALCATWRLHFQIGSLSVGRAKQTLAAMLKTVTDPSISIQHTRRKNTLRAVKCSSKRAKSRTPVPQDVSK